MLSVANDGSTNSELLKRLALELMATQKRWSRRKVIRCCRWRSSQLVARIQVASLESRELPEPIQIMNLDGSLLQREQIALAQLT